MKIRYILPLIGITALVYWSVEAIEYAGIQQSEASPPEMFVIAEKNILRNRKWPINHARH